NRTSEIAEYMGLSIPRVRVMLREMIEEGVIEAEGEGRARVYKVVNISEEM
ncbi:MAG: winged helix-turn-helix transcriptional regulator, partial [Lachnospiraceae bacterium]|nr:winged helix-turn-helix transcriptional regulator [Lachnospiraceae bacterium]